LIGDLLEAMRCFGKIPDEEMLMFSFIKQSISSSGMTKMGEFLDFLINAKKKGGYNANAHYWKKNGSWG